MESAMENRFQERLHKLSGEEAAIEQELTAGISRRFATFQGDIRDAYDALISETPLAGGVTMEEVDPGSVKGWWVRPANPTENEAILYLHGGGYGLGSARAYRGLASQLASRTGVAVFVADYPLAPEHPFPAAYEAAIAARKYLANQGVRRAALVGDSARRGPGVGFSKS